MLAVSSVPREASPLFLLFKCHHLRTLALCRSILNWIKKHNKKAETHNISDDTCLLAVQGPNATRILQPLTEMDIMNLKYYSFVKGKFADVENVLVSATGYTGAGGVEIYFKNEKGN